MSVVSILIKIDVLDICNNVSVFKRIKMKEPKKPFLVPLSVLFGKSDHWPKTMACDAYL